MTLLTLGLLFAFAPTPATAGGLGADCQSTADCDQGLACEVVADAPCDCFAPEPQPDGREGAPLPECECAEDNTQRACLPGPCTSDADCAQGLVCHTIEDACDTAPAPCAGGMDCLPAPECTPDSISLCLPRWMLPCETAADCGGGFVCEAAEICSCTGGSPQVPGPDGGAPLPPEESCECEPADEKHCALPDAPCTQDSDCYDETWRCALQSSDAPCAAPDGGEAPGCEPAPQPATGLCQPRAWDDWGLPTRPDWGGPSDPNTEQPAPNPDTRPGDGEESAASPVATGGCAGALPLSLTLALLPLLLLRRR